MTYIVRVCALDAFLLLLFGQQRHDELADRLGQNGCQGLLVTRCLGLLLISACRTCNTRVLCGVKIEELR